jgi:transposase
MLESHGQRQKEIRTFQTVLAELVTLKAWRQEVGCTHVAMESTGVYWRPIWKVLEGHFELLLAHAQQLKAVPGHTTAGRAAEWIADLLPQGLLRARFVPTASQRALRDLTRSRTRLLQDRSRAVNRLQQVLEGTTSKLAHESHGPHGDLCPSDPPGTPFWTNRSWSLG